LRGLGRDPHTPLHEYAATVKRRGQIAHSKLSLNKWERYTFDTFMQSLNDLRLHNQFLATIAQTVEDARGEGEASLLAAQLHKSRVSSPSG